MSSGLHNISSKPRTIVAGSQRVYTASDVARFRAKVDQSSSQTGCWLWLASSLNRQGHGQFTLRQNGRQFHLFSHRVAWELTHGPIPPGLCVCHACDRPPCVNPAHLFLGTQADNLNDARRKGRLIDGLHARRLSDDAYREILTQPYLLGSGIALARKHGISKNTVSRIRSGRQGSTYRRAQVNVERVPFVQLPVRGVLHVGDSSRSSIDRQNNSLMAVLPW